MAPPSLGTVDLRCRRCPQIRTVRRAVLNRAGKPARRRDRPPATRYSTLEWTPDGPTYLCSRCASRGNANKARRAFLRTKGVNARDGQQRELDVFRAQVAHMVEKAGGANVALAKAHDGARNGYSLAARQRMAIGRVAAGLSRGQFRLCPQCDRLIYLSPEVVKRDSPGLHRACWLASKTRPYARPTRRPGRPRQLKQQLGWLVRHFYFGQSWGEIGDADRFDRTTVRDDVKSFVECLPDTWREVYRGRRPGPILDALLPVPRLRELAWDAQKS